MGLIDGLFNAGKKGKEAKEKIDTVKDLKDIINLVSERTSTNALEVAKQILGEFPTFYELLSGKDFMEPVKNLIDNLEQNDYAAYRELRKFCGKDRLETERQMWKKPDSKTLDKFDELYRLEQKIKEINEKLNPSLKNNEPIGVNFEASSQPATNKTHKIPPLNLAAVAQRRHKQNNSLQDKTQNKSQNEPTPKPTAQISKKPSIAILANLDKLPPQELLAELHRLENLPTKNDFSREIMAKIETQLEKFNQTENPNLETGMKA